MRNRTSDLLRCDALPLSHRDSTASEVYYKVHMTRVLHTARISNVDNSMGNKFLVICAPVGLHFYRLKESLFANTMLYKRQPVRKAVQFNLRSHLAQ